MVAPTRNAPPSSKPRTTLQVRWMVLLVVVNTFIGVLSVYVLSTVIYKKQAYWPIATISDTSNHFPAYIPFRVLMLFSSPLISICLYVAYKELEARLKGIRTLTFIHSRSRPREEQLQLLNELQEQIPDYILSREHREHLEESVGRLPDSRRIADRKCTCNLQKCATWSLWIEAWVAVPAFTILVATLDTGTMCWDCHDTSACVFFIAMSITFLLETITLWRIEKAEEIIQRVCNDQSDSINTDDPGYQNIHHPLPPLSKSLIISKAVIVALMIAALLDFVTCNGIANFCYPKNKEKHDLFTSIGNAGEWVAVFFFQCYCVTYIFGFGKRCAVNLDLDVGGSSDGSSDSSAGAFGVGGSARNVSGSRNCSDRRRNMNNSANHHIRDAKDVALVASVQQL